MYECELEQNPMFSRRSMRLPLFCLLLSVGACAQQPVFNEAFFNGDRAAVLRKVTEEARVLKSRDAKLLAEYGRASLAALDIPKGKELLKLAEAKEPKDGEVLRLIALAWLKNGYKSEALDTYELILKRDPKNKNALAASGVDLAEVGLVNEAGKYMTALATLEPKEWKFFLSFGRAFLVSGHRKLASPWFARAVEIKPREEEVLIQIMRAFTETQSVM